MIGHGPLEQGLWAAINKNLCKQKFRPPSYFLVSLSRVVVESLHIKYYFISIIKSNRDVKFPISIKIKWQFFRYHVINLKWSVKFEINFQEYTIEMHPITRKGLLKIVWFGDIICVIYWTNHRYSPTTLSIYHWIISQYLSYHAVQVQIFKFIIFHISCETLANDLMMESVDHRWNHRVGLLDGKGTSSPSSSCSQQIHCFLLYYFLYLLSQYQFPKFVFISQGLKHMPLLPQFS